MDLNTILFVIKGLSLDLFDSFIWLLQQWNDGIGGKFIVLISFCYFAYMPYFVFNTIKYKTMDYKLWK